MLNKGIKFLLIMEAIMLFFILSVWILLTFAGTSYAAATDSDTALTVTRVDDIKEAKEATLTVRTTSGETFGFYGELNIVDDGLESTPVDLELDGWLVGYDEGDGVGQYEYKQETE